MGSMVTITRIHAGRSGVQILDGAKELPLLQNILARTDGMTTHILTEPSLRISGAIPPLNLSASPVHIGTSLYLDLLRMYI
jgi:hypothetical protein